MKNLGLCQKAFTGQSVYGHALNREILPLKFHTRQHFVSTGGNLSEMKMSRILVGRLDLFKVFDAMLTGRRSGQKL